MAGDPDLATSEALALACAEGGADVLELGIPFSDPIADGPEIQRAGQRALASGTRPRDALILASRIRGKSDVPIVLMTYTNPILALGLEGFARRAQDAGVDGVIVPDLSLEESDEFRETLDAHSVDHVQLVAPSTPAGRAKAIGKASRGFLYVVARYGTTGVRASLPEELAPRLESLHRLVSLPLAVGFGVSTPDQVSSLARIGADGVVVGSALVRRVAEGADPVALQAFVADLRAAAKATVPAPRDNSP